MNNKFSFIFLSLLLLNIYAFAGTLDSIGVAKIEGKLHVKYLVSPGETIYGISTKYGVSVSDLMEINPELENGLKVGQVINIPYNPEAIKPVKKADDNVIVHKVQPGETYFGLSKKYNTTVNDLMRMNNLELKAGQEIIVGYKNQEKKIPTDTSKQVVINTKPEEIKTPDKNINVANKDSDIGNIYPFDASQKQVLVIPFDPYLYFSDADDEIAARSDMNRTKVRQVFRKRLNAMLQAPGYETILLLGGKAKDSLSDLNKIYSSVTYNYQQSIVGPNYQEPEKAPEVKKNKNWIDKQKEKIANNPADSKYDIPTDHGSYFGVQIKNPEFFTFFNTKYSIDYYIFVSQFEVKTNYEHCLDRAAQNYERTFTTHFSIFDSTGKQIAGSKFKTHYNSNSNNIYQILADNMEKIANRILSELPPPNQ
jgi:LysM repeat protein